MKTEHWTTLRDGVAGTLLLPGDPGFDAAVRARPFVAHDGVPAPAAVLRCRDAADVAAAIGFARRHAMPLAVRSGGHCAAGLSSTAGLVIDVSPMDTIELDAGHVVVGGGVRLAGLVEALAAHGRALPTGTCPTVGVSGLALGGGWGMLSRQYGLTCDHLVRAEVVTADSGVVVADERHEPDLFWALRGGGTGGLGVVTSMTFRTVPAPRMTTFQYAWPVAAAAGVLRAWLDRAVDAPARLCAEAGVYPDEVRLHGAMAGTDAETRESMARLCDGLAPPTRVDVTESSYLESARRLAGATVSASDPSLHLYATSEFFTGPLPAETVDALLARFSSGPAGREIGFMPWGGGDHHVAPDATAFPHRLARYVVHHIAVAPDASADARAWVRDMRDTLHPYGTGGVYANFAEPGLADWERAYYGDNAARLRDVKRRYDPDGVFRSAQSLR
ncbi:FAD-binding oxidoreductase [Jiangella rhizosphaerae]|uniref:FAD-binding oxidoreductase n=1 Tax=Jiangella rhizosphaerae TaxID=2293569 RepID=A0A418KSL6_9ACTN|nr:FAD-binding oxidoreductase [Jiangella rhizosphaerae]RIQ26874.1 FAD-binding oxidoreductase [Jiangella rhizosphaerae]